MERCRRGKPSVEGWRGDKRAGTRVLVKEEPPDDQRALKEDWLASALLVLRRACARARAEEELRTFAPVVDRTDAFPLCSRWICEFLQFRLHLIAWLHCDLILCSFLFMFVPLHKFSCKQCTIVRYNRRNFILILGSFYIIFIQYIKY